MDILLIFLSGFFILLGIVGSFLPIIPGPLTSWLGIFILSITQSVFIDKISLVVSFIIAVGIFVLDYFVPVLGAKKFGGGRGSVIGSSIGLICGILFIGPFGIFLGPFFGAFIGELVVNSDNKKGALKAAIGSLIGFLSGVFLKFLISIAFAFFYLKSLINFNINDFLF
tara:strand:- start:39 stop:545 length:507 start_codon:yes stop_codon:yes gene_type:complete